MKLSISKDMARLKTDALNRIDAAFYRNAPKDIKVRLYAAKEAEARRFLTPPSAGWPTGLPVAGAGRCPYLEAESVVKGVTMQELAEVIVAMADKSAIKLAAYEAQRQAIQERIRAAMSPATIDSILEEVVDANGTLRL